MTISIPPGGLQIGVGANGKPANTLTIHVRFDVCPTWVDLSLRHLALAVEAKVARDAVWSGSNEDAKGAALEREFEASMQAIMAAAIALDAFYAVLKDHVGLPPSLVERWRRARTARYSQVTEVIRRAFRLKPKGTAALRANLKEIYRVRDLAVHPSGKIEAPLLHPELNVGVEWRFAYFRASSARLIVDGASWILWDLAHNGKSSNPKIVEYVANLRQRLTTLFPSGHPSAAAAVAPR